MGKHRHERTDAVEHPQVFRRVGFLLGEPGGPVPPPLN
jgi:hypothetical protein